MHPAARTSDVELHASPEICRRLRDVLERSYDAEELQRALAIRHLALLGPASKLPIFRLQLEHSRAYNPVVELFLLGVELDLQRAEEALAPLGVKPLLEAGLLEQAEEGVWARLSLFPYDGVWLAGDRLDTRGTRPGTRVPNTDLSTRLLQLLTIRPPVSSLLDLGTGTGIQALLGARHSVRVHAVDVNPRALCFARFNVLLNEIENVELHEGRWFEPVGDERFDLIVANPPFIISPRGDDPHRYSGRPGDELCRQLVRSAPDHLEEGGLAHVQCEWVHGADEDPFAPVRGWVAGLECDALILYFSSEDSLSYALTYAPDEREGDEPLERPVREWVDSYRRLGIERIAFGLVILRRRSGVENWVRAFRLGGYPGAPAGEHLERLLAGADYLERVSDGELLDARLGLVEGHQLDQRLTWAEGAYSAHDAVLSAGALRLGGKVSPEALRVLFGLDGRRPLRAVLAETASEFGIEERELAQRLLAELRELVARGFLLPER